MLPSVLYARVEPPRSRAGFWPPWGYPIWRTRANELSGGGLHAASRAPREPVHRRPALDASTTTVLRLL